MTSKERILSEIRRLAGPEGVAPGKTAFAAATGIAESEWSGRFWRSWSDAVTEAGLRPNQMNTRLPSDYVLERYAEVARSIGRVPTIADLKLYARAHAGFPSHNTFTKHYGNKAALVEALRQLPHQKPEYADLREFLPPEEALAEDPREPAKEGYVYLLRSGQHYKIGRSDQIERRVKEISISLPESVDLVHVIRTDDPAGIEAYWHRRFSDMRANGEWFRLDGSALKAFKRRKFQ